MGIERRQGYRIELFKPLCADIRVAMINNKRVKLNTKSKICILNIGLGGVKFKSNLRLPVKDNIVLNITLRLNGEFVTVSGTIVRSVKVCNNFEYGFKFNTNPELEDILVSKLNHLAIVNKKQTDLESCNYCTDLESCELKK